MSQEMLRQRARSLRLWGLLAHWDEVATQGWVEEVVRWTEDEKRRRSLEYRTGKAKLGAMKSMGSFDWEFPEKIDRAQIEELFTLGFVREAVNVVLAGPNGVGKTMIAQNLANEALLKGHSVLFTSASAMLGELAACDGARSLEQALNKYTRPHLLAIDEVGYLAYGARHADLLFEVVTRRYEQRSTIVTTNRVFKEWGEVFPNAACVVALVDRLLHRAEVVHIQGESYRAKEAELRRQRKLSGTK